MTWGGGGELAYNLLETCLLNCDIGAPPLALKWTNGDVSSRRPPLINLTRESPRINKREFCLTHEFSVYSNLACELDFCPGFIRSAHKLERRPYLSGMKRLLDGYKIICFWPLYPSVTASSINSLIDGNMTGVIFSSGNNNNTI